MESVLCSFFIEISENQLRLLELVSEAAVG